MSWKMGSTPSPKAVFVLLLLVAQGYGLDCDPRDIVVDQSIEGKKGMDYSMSVLILNHCRCAISNLHVRANGFSSSEPVDPSVFRRDGDTYLVNDGRPIKSNGYFGFYYLFDHAFNLTPAYWNIDC